MFGKRPWNKGIPRTPEERSKMSASQKANSEDISKRMSGKNNPMFGRHLSDEQKRRLSVSFSGENNPFYDKRHSEATKSLIKSYHKDDSKPVEMKDVLTNEVITVFPSLHDAARYIDGIRGEGKADKSFISRCANGKYKKAYGFAWSFSERCND